MSDDNTGANYLPTWDLAKCLRITQPGETEPVLWAPAELLAEVTKERDDFRRTLALINAWRVGGMDSIAELDRLLRVAGFDFEDGRVMLGLIRWSREESVKRESAPAPAPDAHVSYVPGEDPEVAALREMVNGNRELLGIDGDGGGEER